MGILSTCDRTILFFFLSFYLFGISNISGVNGILPKKIYGGRAVEPNKYSRGVSIQLHNHHVCGGVILSSYHILSAASCVLADTYVAYGNLKILSGTKDLLFGNEDRYAKFYEVAYIIFHIDYEPRNAWQNDIALLKTASSIDFTIRCNSASMPTKGLSSSLYVIGWGIDPFTKIMTRYLQILNIQTLNHFSCNEKYFSMDYLHKYQHCLVLPKTAQITQGNAGSPVMVGRRVVGIISSLPWNSNEPVVYTRVHGYIDWIEEMIEEIKYIQLR